MNQDARHRLTSGLQNTTFQINSQRWWLYVLDVVRVGGDAFLHVALLGPRTVTATVALPRGRVASPELVVSSVRDWLSREEGVTEGFIELDEEPHHACGGSIM
jgi:hypothetical protein